MRRGEVWTAAGAGSYLGKPRPVLIIQSNLFPETISLTVCGLTSDTVDAGVFRVALAPSATNGLRLPSRVMVDKIVTLEKPRFGHRIGELDLNDLARIDRAIALFLGLDAISPTAS